jgi:hypothetical protein
LSAEALPEPRWGRSILAVFLGFVFVVVLSTGIDELLHALKVYPPHGERMPQPGLNLLALTYRVLITIAAAALTAKLAPHRSVQSDWRHVWVLGGIGLALGTIGAITMIPKDFGPAWYPILLALSALPCAWAGGKLAIRERPATTLA